jgi:hypothetical protein
MVSLGSAESPFAEFRGTGIAFLRDFVAKKKCNVSKGALFATPLGVS